MAKLSKVAVKFQHPAQGKDKCGDCKHYEVHGPEMCEIVAGHIESGDWCDRFAKSYRMAKVLKEGK